MKVEAGPVEVWDSGLQPERTALAWRRTSFSLAAGSLIAMKVLSEVIGIWGAIAGCAGFAGAAIVFGLSERRYRELHRGLHRDGVQTSSARMLAMMATTVIAVGLISLAIVCAMFAHRLN